MSDLNESSEDFWSLSREDQVTYLTENIRNLPDELVDPGIDILTKAGETEYAIALAKDSGRTKKAVEIAVDEGDYLWAALIAKKGGMEAEAKRLYWEGLEYYISMEMYGRAVSAAEALELPQREIDLLFEAGIRSEGRKMDMGRARSALDSMAATLESALAGRNDETAEELRSAMRGEIEKVDKRSFED